MGESPTLPEATALFDAFTQVTTWYAQNETTLELEEVPMSMSDISTFWFENMHLGLVYGAQLGLASLMLLVLLLLTQPGKRRAPIYILNTVTLVLDLIRSALMAHWLTSIWNHPVVQLLGDYSRLSRGDYAASVLVNVVKTIELAVVLSSLLLQVRVILTTATSAQRAVILSVAFVLGMVTLCVQLASTVVNSRNIVRLTQTEDFSLQIRLANLSRILQLVSTSFFMLVFATKLGFAIKQRYKLGNSRFGPMQMVFIGSLQSMLIPVVFIAAQWSTTSDFGSLSMTVLAIQLPLTALWASTSLEERVRGAQQPNPAKQRPIALGPGHSGDSGEKHLMRKEVSTALSSPPSTPAKGKASVMDSGYGRGESIPMTTTMRSLDVAVKMDERDMV